MGAAQARLSLHLSKCHIVGNHMLPLNFYYSRYHCPMGWPTGTASSTKDQEENIQKNTCMCFDLLFYSVLMVFPSRKFRSLRSRYMNKCCFYAVEKMQ